MLFFASVLILWASTSLMGGQDLLVLAPVTQWAAWTFTLYLCGAAALQEGFRTLLSRLLGIFGYNLTAIYYLTQHTTYMDFIPADTANPDLWPAIFFTINLAAPMVLITLGCLGPAVQRSGKSA